MSFPCKRFYNTIKSRKVKFNRFNFDCSQSTTTEKYAHFRVCVFLLISPSTSQESEHRKDEIHFRNSPTAPKTSLRTNEKEHEKSAALLLSAIGYTTATLLSVILNVHAGIYK